MFNGSVAFHAFVEKNYTLLPRLFVEHRNLTIQQAPELMGLSLSSEGTQLEKLSSYQDS